MGIVVLHGAGPGSGKPNVVGQQWHDALVTGLQAAGLTNAEEQDIRLAFYGDLGRDRRASAKAPPTDLQVAIAHEVLANGRVDEQPEWDRLADLVARLHDDIGADKALLTRFLVDVDAYFGNPDVRERALEAARSACLESPGPTVLLGHAMGGIVAYDLLATEESEALGVESLLTYGSPLGIPSIRKQVEWIHPRTPFPTGLRRWIDIATELDFTTVEGELAKLYRAQDGRRVESIVIPLPESDRGNAHDPQTYLASVAFAEAVLDLLSAKAGVTPELEPPADRITPANRSAASPLAAGSVTRGRRPDRRHAHRRANGLSRFPAGRCAGLHARAAGRGRRARDPCPGGGAPAVRRAGRPARGHPQGRRLRGRLRGPRR